MILCQSNWGILFCLSGCWGAQRCWEECWSPCSKGLVVTCLSDMKIGGADVCEIRKLRMARKHTGWLRIKLLSTEIRWSKQSKRNRAWSKTTSLPPCHSFFCPSSCINNWPADIMPILKTVMTPLWFGSAILFSMSVCLPCILHSIWRHSSGKSQYPVFFAYWLLLTLYHFLYI